ncbi:MAG TPA: DsbA family protein [Acidimicrobiia bacterium]|nr:DsbA family protein [Acidimicrobiia bacterium]
MARTITVTFDYRCPFAYNGNATLMAGAEALDLEPRYLAFSLDQAHVGEGEPPMWERDPADWGSGVLALLYGIAARDTSPEVFPAVHLALFAARHDHGRKIDDAGVLHDAISGAGGDPAALADEVASGRPLKTLEAEHTEGVERWGVWGVPTFIEGDDAAFVRLMQREDVDDLARVLALLPVTDINEFKRPRIDR